MKNIGRIALKLIVLGIALAPSAAVQAQVEPMVPDTPDTVVQDNVVQDNVMPDNVMQDTVIPDAQYNSPQPLPTDASQEIPAELTTPLEVDQQQADQFFTPPPRPQPTGDQSVPTVTLDELVSPPPGSQTPNQLTPNQQLSIPIR